MDSCINQWAQLEKVDNSWLDEWSCKVWDDVKKKVAEIKRATHSRRRTYLSSTKGKEALARLHQKYVIVPTDKSWK